MSRDSHDFRIRSVAKNRLSKIYDSNANQYFVSYTSLKLDLNAKQLLTRTIIIQNLIQTLWFQIPVCDYVELWNALYWNKRAPLNHARADFSASVIHGRIYVVGGYGNVEEFLDMEYYSSRSDGWTVIPRSMIKWPGVRAAVSRNVLYLFHGEVVSSYRKDRRKRDEKKFTGREYDMAIGTLSNIFVR